MNYFRYDSTFRLRPRTLGDIAGYALHTGWLAILKREARVHFEHYSMSVFGNDLQGISRVALFRGFTSKQLPGFLKVFRRDDLRDVHSESLFSGIADDLSAGLVN